LSLDQIDRLVRIVLKEKTDDRGGRFDFEARYAAISAIAAYGESAIPALTQVTEESTNPVLREHALEAIKTIKRS
jgi:HEAT repeat protein